MAEMENVMSRFGLAPKFTSRSLSSSGILKPGRPLTLALVCLFSVAPAFGGFFEDVGGAVSEGLKKANEEATRAAAEANRKATEAAAEANRRATEAAAEANRRATEAAAEANRRATEAVAEENRKRTEELAAANKKLTEEAAKANAAATGALADANSTATQGLAQTNAFVTQGVQQAAEQAKKLKSDVEWNLQKAAKDTVAETGRVASGLGDAAEAIGRFLDNQVRSIGPALTNAERRLREGKVVDALWHLSTEPTQSTSRNAALAVQESAYLNTVAQVAATAYGGPQGAAAYAAWLTFNQTGDADLALRAGVLTYATSLAFKSAGTIDSSELAKKAAVTAAIGGLAVAAAGGNEAAIKEGFLRAGAMVVIQDGYQRYAGSEIDGRSSKGEAYCMSAENEACSPPKEAYIRDAKGEIVRDSQGQPVIDMKKIDPRIPHVGKWSEASGVKWDQERSTFMTSVSRVPGMNAMALFHDQWSVSWDMGPTSNVATIIPAVVLTYTGTGAPYYDLLQRTVATKAVGANVAGVQSLTALGPPASAASGAITTAPAVATTQEGALFATQSALQTVLCTGTDTSQQIVVDITVPEGTACRTVVVGADAVKVIHTADSAQACLVAADKYIDGLSKAGSSCFSRSTTRLTAGKTVPLEIRKAVNEQRGRPLPGWSLGTLGAAFLGILALSFAGIGYASSHVHQRVRNSRARAS